MISNRWIEQRQGLWQRLDALLVQAESSGLKSLSGDELRELGLLYRQIAQDLSAVRGDRGSRTQEEYLNLLLARAHNRVYSGRKLEARQVVRFFAAEYPQIFRRLFPYVAAAVIIFLAGAALGTLLTFSRPAFARILLGPAMVASIERHEMWTHSLVGMKPQASTWIMTNNISVGFMTFAGGIAAGLGTLYLLFYNGLQLGVVATACAQARMALDLWSFVASHGALELPSIFIAGGAGLRLATGMLFPGIYTRSDSLSRAAVDAIRLVAGTVPLLVIAGTLEGFLSPSGAPVAVKFLTGAVLLLGLGLWLTSGDWPSRRTRFAPQAENEEPVLTGGLEPSLPDTH
ncbi:MAG: stage II sporulation protein M [Acidobacteriaceae bacterium]